MAKKHHPRRGSMQIWPRRRAKRVLPRVRTFPQTKQTKLLGFIGYKAGMTHIQVRDNNASSLTNGQLISFPATIIDCPPINIKGVRLYKKTDKGYQTLADHMADKKKEITFPDPNTFDKVKVLIASQPTKTSTGKKQPDLLEVAVGGKTNEEQLEKIKELLTKEITIADVLDEGQFVDIHAVTKGKGFQGTVKRYGVKIRQHKSEKTKRGVGNLGAWTPKRVQYTVAQPGRMGYHQRTEYNKLILKLAKPEEVNQKGGILHYGIVNNDCVLIKGSVAGPANIPVVLAEAQRAKKKPGKYEIVNISTESKQGR